MRAVRIAAVMLGWGVLALAPRRASACGGTFCDGAPVVQPGQAPRPPMAVDQSGENILFVVSPDQVEAHVQIQYTGNPAKFAWIVPMPVVPTVTVGSQALFTNLGNGSVPTYATTSTIDTCVNGVQPSSSNDNFACGSSTSDEALDEGAATPTGSFGGSSASGQDAGVQIVAQEQVGAFEVTILTSQTLDELTTFLSTNGYAIPDAAPPLFQEYLDEGYYFVAVKLVPGANDTQIHPLVFTYPGSKPCIPLRLTAVAATEDMGVRAFFLGTGRILPSTYKHVVLNESAIDWTNPGSNYDAVVSQAMNDPLVEGRGFVTEYAGSSGVVSKGGLFGAAWDASTYAAGRAEDVVDELTAQGLLDCSSANACTSPHPLVFPLLATYLPPPVGISAAQFYADLHGYASMIDATVWDGQKFADDFDARIVEPGKHAAQIVEANPYLTRLFTRISPAEMTADPDFVERDDLPGVALAHSSVERTACNAKYGMEVEDGRSIGLAGPNTPWPTIAGMPAASRIESVSASGPVDVVKDYGAAIDAAVAAYNAPLSWPPQPQFAVQSPASQSQGCGCQVPPMRASSGVLSLLAVLGLLRRRARKHAA